MKRTAVDILRDLVVVLPQTTALVEGTDKDLGAKLDDLLKEARQAIKEAIKKDIDAATPAPVA